MFDKFCKNKAIWNIYRVIIFIVKFILKRISSVCPARFAVCLLKELKCCNRFSNINTVVSVKLTGNGQ